METETDAERLRKIAGLADAYASAVREWAEMREILERAGEQLDEARARVSGAEAALHAQSALARDAWSALQYAQGLSPVSAA